MTEGAFESLKAIHTVAPNFVPEPYAWGRYCKEEPETYFLLAELREVGEQPPDPIRFTSHSEYHYFKTWILRSCKEHVIERDYGNLLSKLSALLYYQN